MYNPLLRTWILEKSFGGKSISDVLTAFIKSDFTLVWKTLEKWKTVYFCLNIRWFYRLVHFIIIIFFFAIMHPDAPALLPVPLINRFNESSEKKYISIAIWHENFNTD